MRSNYTTVRCPGSITTVSHAIAAQLCCGTWIRLSLLLQLETFAPSSGAAALKDCAFLNPSDIRKSGARGSSPNQPLQYAQKRWQMPAFFAHYCRTWTRTKILSSRGRSPTIRRSGKIMRTIPQFAHNSPKTRLTQCGRELIP